MSALANHASTLAVILLLCTPASLHAQAPADANSEAPAPTDAATEDKGSVPLDLEAPALVLLPQTPANEGGIGADQAARLAVKHSPRARMAELDSAHAARRSKRASWIFVPRVDLTASYDRLSPVPEFAVPGGGGADLSAIAPVILNQTAFRAGLIVPISDYFLVLGDRYQSAQHLSSFSDLRREGERQSVAFEAQRQLYQLARAVAALALAEHRVVQLGSFVSEINTLVVGGELGSVDLAQAEARLSAAEAEALRAQASKHTVAEGLRRQLGLPAQAKVGAAENLIETMPPPPTDLPALKDRAQGQRAEVRALLALIKARKSTRDAVDWERYPKFNGRGHVLVANPNQRHVPAQEEFDATWSVGVELTWSPTDMAIKNQGLDDAQLEVARAQQDLLALRERIELEVTEGYENAVAAGGAVRTSQLAVKSAEETLRVRAALFRAGESSSRMVLDAELDLRVAQQRWIDDVLTTHLARASLDLATGSLAY